MVQTGKVVFVKQSSGWYVVQTKEHDHVLLETEADIAIGDVVSGVFEPRGYNRQFLNRSKRIEFEAFVVDNYLTRKKLRELHGF